MKKITYICFYSIEKYIEEKRHYPLSGALKIDGIISALSEQGFEIEIVSVSPSHGDKFCKKHSEKISEQVSLRLFSSLGRKNIIMKILDYLWIHLQLLFYFIMNVKRNDCLIVYHSMYYVNLIYFLKKLFGYKLILELEEIYADVVNKDRYRTRELRLVNEADGFILPTVLLKRKIKDKKPCVIIHGTYKNEKKIADKDDELIHIVYAGTLDPRKGSIEAIKAAEYLSRRYCIHILGTGTEECIHDIREEINTVNEKNGAFVIYEGIKTGDEYNAFLQKCDIGLCTQDPTASFSDTSFPSKILSYLSNGLRVLSIKIPAVETSDVNTILYYYDEQNPQNIAQAIERIELEENYDSDKCLQELYNKSKQELSLLVKEIM